MFGQHEIDLSIVAHLGILVMLVLILRMLHQITKKFRSGEIQEVVKKEIASRNSGSGRMMPIWMVVIIEALKS